MILYQGPRDSFLVPLQAVCGIVEKRHTLPILSNVLLEKQGERLMLLATDIEMQIRTSTQSVGVDQAAATVAARKLQDILRSLPESAEVSLTLDERRLQLRAGKSRFNLQTLPAEDYPRMAEASGKPTTLKLTQKQFRRQLALVQYAMAQQDIRYYLNGMLLVVQGNEMKLVATDGHRLAYVSEAVADGPAERIEAILPRKTVVELARQLADNDDVLEISLLPTQARFNFGNIEFVSKLIDGKFPDFERVIPQHQGKIINVGHTLLQQALQRAAILTNEKFRGVRLVLSPGSLKILSNNAENEEAQEEIEVEYGGETIDIGFNVNYLLDVLNYVASEQIEIRLADSNSSALIMLPGNENFKYVVMPMRI